MSENTIPTAGKPKALHSDSFCLTLAQITQESARRLRIMSARLAGQSQSQEKEAI